MRVALPITADDIKLFASACGFELAGITSALPTEDFSRFDRWRTQGYAGEMSYLTDQRGDLRNDARHLLPEAVSIVCVGKLYNTPEPYTEANPDRGWFSRYAWGEDYHVVLREGLTKLADCIRQAYGQPFESRICVDTAPLLERSYARAAGLGWIGKNTCLINQRQGSWFFLGELLISLPLTPDVPPPNRCGVCTRCIDACPTGALVPDGEGHWTLDARNCISYLTIEKRGGIPERLANRTANQIFGCDICQDVCPWNRRAPVTSDERFLPREIPRSLETLGQLTEDEFRALFRLSPVWRAKYEGFLRNVAIAMGNSGNLELSELLTRMASHPNEVVSAAARKALQTLKARFQHSLPH